MITRQSRIQNNIRVIKHNYAKREEEEKNDALMPDLATGSQLAGQNHATAKPTYHCGGRALRVAVGGRLPRPSRLLVELELLDLGEDAREILHLDLSHIAHLCKSKGQASTRDEQNKRHRAHCQCTTQPNMVQVHRMNQPVC